MKTIPKILFMGTPRFAATSLARLVNGGFNVIGVITQPDRVSGRGHSKKVGPFLAPTKKGPTFLEAEKHHIPVYQPENKAELTEAVKETDPELIVVAAYGMIVPQEVLDVPKYGALNIHGSLLPKYRGASPISEAILNGDHETGITIMKMSAGMDEGDIISSFALQILKDDTMGTLTEKMAELGAKAIVETIPDWVAGALKATPQDADQATYCRKISKEDGHIDWERSALDIVRLVRAYNPWPSAYFFIDGKRIKVLAARKIPGLRPEITKTGEIAFEEGHIYASTGSGTLEILELQPEGKKPMLASDFINGNQDLRGRLLN